MTINPFAAHVPLLRKLFGDIKNIDCDRSDARPWVNWPSQVWPVKAIRAGSIATKGRRK